MRNVFGGVFGMEIVDEVIIEGHAYAPDKADQIIAEGLERVKEAAKKVSSRYCLIAILKKGQGFIPCPIFYALKIFYDINC